MSYRNPFEALHVTLTTATFHLGGKEVVERYLRDFYFDINTSGDLIVHEMIDVFASTAIPTAAAYKVPHSDSALVELCAQHIVEEALVPAKMTEWVRRTAAKRHATR